MLRHAGCPWKGHGQSSRRATTVTKAPWPATASSTGAASWVWTSRCSSRRSITSLPYTPQVVVLSGSPGYPGQATGIGHRRPPEVDRAQDGEDPLGRSFRAHHLLPRARGPQRVGRFLVPAADHQAIRLPTHPVHRRQSAGAADGTGLRIPYGCWWCLHRIPRCPSGSRGNFPPSGTVRSCYRI